jgi:hypothetical protein
MAPNLVPRDRIERSTLLIREHKVVLDADLAVQALSLREKRCASMQISCLAHRIARAKAPLSLCALFDIAPTGQRALTVPRVGYYKDGKGLSVCLSCASF